MTAQSSAGAAEKGGEEGLGGPGGRGTLGPGNRGVRLNPRPMGWAGRAGLGMEQKGGQTGPRKDELGF